VFLHILIAAHTIVGNIIWRKVDDLNGVHGGFDFYGDLKLTEIFWLN